MFDELRRDRRYNNLKPKGIIYVYTISRIYVIAKFLSFLQYITERIDYRGSN